MKVGLFFVLLSKIRGI